MASVFLVGPKYSGSIHQLKLSRFGKLSGWSAGISCSEFDFWRLRKAVAIAGSVSFLFCCVFARSLCNARCNGWNALLACTCASRIPYCWGEGGGEESFYPDRPLGSDPNDYDMDSSVDSNDQPKTNKKGKKWQGSANTAVSKAHFDAILDCGASDIFFPHKHEDKTDIHYQAETISLSDKSSVSSYATAKYGILNVTLSHDIFWPLIATGYLTYILDFYLFYIKKQAYILKKIVNEKVSGECYSATVATCTYRSDKLYHFDDITKFLEPLNTIDVKPSSLNMTISRIPYLKNEILKGSGRVFHQ